MSRWLKCKESSCQCTRHRFDPWVGKIPWRRKWQPTLVFLLGQSSTDRGAWQAAVHEVAESDMTERLTNNNRLKKTTTTKPGWCSGHCGVQPRWPCRMAPHCLSCGVLVANPSPWREGAPPPMFMPPLQMNVDFVQ